MREPDEHRSPAFTAADIRAGGPGRYSRPMRQDGERISPAVAADDRTGGPERFSRATRHRRERVISARGISAVLARHDLLLAAVIVLAVIAVGAGLGWHNNQTVQLNPNYSYKDEPNNPLSYLSNWDGPGYINVAVYGYPSYLQAGLFPFYPMLIFAVHRVIPSALVSALLIAWLSFIGAVYFFIKVVRRLYGVSDTFGALQAITFFVLFPTGVFLYATYTESLFAMLSLAAIYLALGKRFVWSSILLLLATATHVTGVFVVIFVGLILLEQREKLRNILFTVAVGSCGLLAYTIYLYVHLHDALAFLRSLTHVNQWMQRGWLSLVEHMQYFNAIFVVLLVLAAWFWWRRRRSFSVYAALYLLIPLAGQQFGGFNRYVLMAFPVQLMLYEVFRNKKHAFPYVVAFMAVIWTYFMLQYAGGYIGSGG